MMTSSGWRGWTVWVLLWGGGRGTGGEPVTLKVPTCPGKVYIESGTIIDIRGSTERGALVLEGRREASSEGCVQRCCAVEGCELSLFKMEGYSDSGNNCYLIQCGRMENCLMVGHQGFMSVFQEELIMKSGSDGETERPTLSSTWLPDKTESGADPSTKEPSGATPPSPASLSPDPTTSADGHTTTSEPVSSEPAPQTNTTAATPTNTAVDDPSPGAGSPQTGNEDGGSSAPTVATGDDEKELEEEPYDPNDCDKNGCDGKGVIAVVVVTSVCVLVIVVVAVLILRRVVRNVRKRRYRNVDYLINGMYS